MRRIGILLLSLAAIALLSGCSVRHGDFTILTNRNISDLDLSNDQKIGETEGKDVQPYFLFIPLSGPPVLEDAVDNALMPVGGDYLTDAVIRYSTFWAVLYGENKMTVSGTAWKMQ